MFRKDQWIRERKSKIENVDFSCNLYPCLSACSDAKKSAFLERCIKGGDPQLSAEQNKFSCKCMADAISSNKKISDEGKKAVAEGKEMLQLPEDDTGLILGLAMTCYAEAKKR